MAENQITSVDDIAHDGKKLEEKATELVRVRDIFMDVC